MKSSKMSPARAQSSPVAIEASFARSLRSLASAALAGAALLAVSSSALAGVPGLTVTVNSLAPTDPITSTRPIAYSTAAVTYQTAYKVTMTASSPVNTAFFYAFTNTTVSGLNAPFVAVPDLRAGDSCASPVGSPTEMDCVIGSIAAGGTVQFTLLVTSPLPPSPATDSLLQLTWAVQAGQGQPNPSNLVHQGSQDVTLHVGSAADGVQSYVTSGSLGVADNNSSTNVTPPSAVTVGVKQTIVLSSCTAHFNQCLSSTVRIVDDSGTPIPFSSSNPLVIDLVRAASTLKKNAKIANATINYTEVLPDGSLGATYVIQDCVNGPAWEIPSGQSRCVVPALKNATTLTYQDASGNWHFHIIALTNGIMNW